MRNWTQSANSAVLGTSVSIKQSETGIHDKLCDECIWIIIWKKKTNIWLIFVQPTVCRHMLPSSLLMVFRDLISEKSN